MEIEQDHLRNNAIKYAAWILLLSAILYFGSAIFVPMSYGLLIAIVLYPVCKWLESRGWSRSLAVTAGLLIVFILFGLLLLLVVLQLQAFRKDLPEIIQKVQPSWAQLQEWIQANLGIAVSAQEDWWQNTVRNLSGNTGGIIRSTIVSTGAALFTLFLVPVYAALFLYNRETFVRFLEKIAGKHLGL